MAMLAFMDHPRVSVYRRPRVGVISTGDELGPVGRKRPYGHIPDSNRYGLLGLIESAGCAPVDGGSVGDTPEKLLAALKRMRSRVDFILTTGGVSAGDFDVVKVLFQKIGGVDLYRLRIKPGKPQAFGQLWGIPYFGLPGNPVSAMVVFDFLVRPALRKMAGAVDVDLRGIHAEAVRPFPKKSRDWEFPRAIATGEEGRWRVEPTSTQKSSDLMSMVQGTGYVVLPPGCPSPETGTNVLYIPFPV
jgi:molybdopterin molybdotransferase